MQKLVGFAYHTFKLQLKLRYFIIIFGSAFDTSSVLRSVLGGVQEGESFDITIFPGSCCYCIFVAIGATGEAESSALSTVWLN